MRCFVGLLLLGLCLGVGAHDTPRIRDGSYTHTPSEDWHEDVRARWPEDHWHYSERQAGAWYQCVADVYDETTDRYDFVAMRVRCSEGGGSTDSGVNVPTSTPPTPSGEGGGSTDFGVNVPTSIPLTPSGDDSVPPTTQPDVPRGDTHQETESSGKTSVSMEALAFSYNHTFPAGVSLQHIPFDIKDFNESGVAVNSVPGVYNQLGDSVASLIASRGVSGWTYVTYPNFPAHNAIWKSIGFAAIMHEEVTVEITGTFGNWAGQPPMTYQILHLREGGLTLLGVPLQSASLRTVGDFYTFFNGVTSVKGISPDLDVGTLERPLRITDDWFVELDHDVEIDGTTSYLITSSEEGESRTLWGVPWAYEAEAQAAPGAQWDYYKKIATTWGAIKSR